MNKDVIYRLIRGERRGANSRTIERLWPFLYGDKQPQEPEHHTSA